MLKKLKNVYQDSNAFVPCQTWSKHPEAYSRCIYQQTKSMAGNYVFIMIDVSIDAMYYLSDKIKTVPGITDILLRRKLMSRTNVINYCWTNTSFIGLGIQLCPTYMNGMKHMPHLTPKSFTTYLMNCLKFFPCIPTNFQWQGNIHVLKRQYFHVMYGDKDVLKENLQCWRLLLQIILYLSFRPLVNQTFCEFCFDSLSPIESRFGSLWVSLVIIVLRHCSPDTVECSVDKLIRSASWAEVKDLKQYCIDLKHLERPINVNLNNRHSFSKRKWI